MTNWLRLERKPEPEVMDEEEEVAAYASAAGQKHLDAIDNTLVNQVISIGSRRGRLAGWLLDLGCGPGSIALKIALSCPELRIAGVDRSAKMILAASRAAIQKGVANRVFFYRADAGHLCFPNCSFDVVVSNSVLHHLADPKTAFEEMERVTKHNGIALLRDLRRPSRLAFPFYVRWHGRHYSGAMRKLFENSVRAAYTPSELAGLLRSTPMSQANIFLHERTHLGFVYKREEGFCG
jgi:ubiquinone/menaquinone biosynthesis C-methylase UbiE